MALALQIGPDRAAADAALKTLIDKGRIGCGYQIAQVYEVRQDADKTFEWLNHAWTRRDPGISNLLVDRMTCSGVVKSDGFTPKSAKPNSFRTATIFAAFSGLGRRRMSRSPVKRGRA